MPSELSMPIGTLLCTLLALGMVVERANAAKPPSGAVHVATPNEGRWIALRTGRLFLPDRLQDEQNECDLLIHFHGDPDTVSREFQKASTDAALIVINYPGLSSAYRVPFSDHQLFASVLKDATSSLRESNRLTAKGKLGRVYVASFSAGYGAVREILKVPAYFERIDGYLAADSIYASLATPDRLKQTAQATSTNSARPVNAAQMTSFRRFAERAIRQEKTFLITHSQLFTPTYASTVDTAADLLAHVGLRRTRIARIDSGEMKTMELLSRAEKGNLTVLEYAGKDGKSHMEHLRRIGNWLPLLMRPGSKAEVPLNGSAHDAQQ